jgi:nicotinamide-nucleotide amidase
MTAFPVTVVAVGDELLLGEVVDTNTGEIGLRLAGVGADLVQVFTVRDDVAQIATAVRAAAAISRLVVVTGGLGPTSDDVTEEALAVVAGPAGSLQQLPNPVGTAPGLLLELEGAAVVAVPGVPAEMRALLDQEVVPRVRTSSIVGVEQLRVPLLGETDVAARLWALVAELPPTVRLGYLVEPGMTRVRMVGPASDVAPLAEVARTLLGPLIASEGDETLAACVVRELQGAGATVATAESLTGGLVGAELTSVPGCSAVYRGGVVAYATEVKASMLGVDAELLEREGAVHPEVARQLSAAVRDRMGATYGVGTTGVAGPAEQDGRRVGTVHVAVTGPAGSRLLTRELTRPSREIVRAWTVNAALELLRRTVLDLPGGPWEEDL